MDIRRLVFGCVVGMVIVLVAACGGGDGDSNEYPSEVQSNFMDGCMGAGATQTQCNCAFDKVREKYTLDEFVQLENDISEGRRTDELTPIILECR
ncbi:MAG: hypothetical protein GEU75_05460 [Dehalococcoidia bacterium]|nr:hypothetical protein [Dehalococcoidia bacterium]